MVVGSWAGCTPLGEVAATTACPGRDCAQPASITAKAADIRQPVVDIRIRLFTLSPLISFYYFRPRA